MIHAHTGSTPNIRMMVYCSLFTALIIIGTYMAIPIPISPVPIVLADFFVMLAGLFIGWKYGLISVLLYWGLGLLGLPVFSGASSGFAAFVGPTGGFLIGYLLLVVMIGVIVDKGKPTWMTHLVALLLGNILLYTSGIVWLKISLDMNWVAAITAGLVPFIPGTIIKIVAVLVIGKTLVLRFKR